MDTVTSTALAQPTAPAHPKPRAVPLTFTIFALCLIGLFVAAIAISVIFTATDGAYMWVMVMLGAVIIAILLSSVFLPFLKELRAHR